MHLVKFNGWVHHRASAGMFHLLFVYHHDYWLGCWRFWACQIHASCGLSWMHCACLGDTLQRRYHIHLLHVSPSDRCMCHQCCLGCHEYCKAWLVSSDIACASQCPRLLEWPALKTVNMLSMGVICCSQCFGHNLLPTEMYVFLCYVSYVLKHYRPGTIVVFDCYSTISPKTAEQQRHAQRFTSSDIMFDENMATTTSQAPFLSNSHNKQCVMDVLHHKMLTDGIVAKQADVYADSLIVSTALALAHSSKPVVVVSTDTDILVMLVTQRVLNMDLHMLCQKNPTIKYSWHPRQHWWHMHLSDGDTSNKWMWYHLCSVSPRQAQVIQFSPQEAWIWHAQNIKSVVMMKYKKQVKHSCWSSMVHPTSGLH